MNLLQLEGKIEKNIFSNGKVSKYEVRTGKKKVNITTFEQKHMKALDSFIGDDKDHKLECTVYESNYKDKQGNWINNTTVQVKQVLN